MLFQPNITHFSRSLNHPTSAAYTQGTAVFPNCPPFRIPLHSCRRTHVCHSRGRPPHSSCHVTTPHGAHQLSHVTGRQPSGGTVTRACARPRRAAQSHTRQQQAHARGARSVPAPAHPPSKPRRTPPAPCPPPRPFPGDGETIQCPTRRGAAPGAQAHKKRAHGAGATWLAFTFPPEPSSPGGGCGTSAASSGRFSSKPGSPLYFLRIA